MKKDVQEALENAIAEFEKRQQAELERLRERERFEIEWARIRAAVVLPALEEVAVSSRPDEDMKRSVHWISSSP